MTEEMKKEQPSVRSFRVTDDVMGKFKDIQQEMGLTQDKALSMLVKAYEMERSKSAIPDRETEISNFQTKVTEITEAFLYSLQLNKDAEVRIRGEVALQLETKDNTIADLQEKVKAKEELATTANSAFMEEENKRKQAEQALKEAQEKTVAAEKTAKDKENIAEMLTAKLTESEKKLDGYDDLKESEANLKTSLSEALQTIKDNKKDAEIAQERAVSAIQKKMDKAITDLEKEHTSVISKLEKERTELESKRVEEMKALYDQIRTLVERNSKLEIANSKLENSLAAL